MLVVRLHRAPVRTTTGTGCKRLRGLLGAYLFSFFRLSAGREPSIESVGNCRRDGFLVLHFVHASTIFRSVRGWRAPDRI